MEYFFFQLINRAECLKHDPDSKHQQHLLDRKNFCDCLHIKSKWVQRRVCFAQNMQRPMKGFDTLFQLLGSVENQFKIITAIIVTMAQREWFELCVWS